MNFGAKGSWVKWDTGIPFKKLSLTQGSNWILFLRVFRVLEQTWGFWQIWDTLLYNNVRLNNLWTYSSVTGCNIFAGKWHQMQASDTGLPRQVQPVLKISALPWKCVSWKYLLSSKLELWHSVWKNINEFSVQTKCPHSFLLGLFARNDFTYIPHWVSLKVKVEWEHLMYKWSKQKLLGHSHSLLVEWHKG